MERYLDYDREGIVFGRPDQVELDVIIHNGTLILCEIKSSLSKSDLYAFWRKKNYYECQLRVEKRVRVSGCRQRYLFLLGFRLTWCYY